MLEPVLAIVQSSSGKLEDFDSIAEESGIEEGHQQQLTCCQAVVLPSAVPAFASASVVACSWAEASAGMALIVAIAVGSDLAADEKALATAVTVRCRVAEVVDAAEG